MFMRRSATSCYLSVVTQEKRSALSALGLDSASLIKSFRLKVLISWMNLNRKTHLVITLWLLSRIKNMHRFL